MLNSLDEAISHCLEVAEEQENFDDFQCDYCELGCEDGVWKRTCRLPSNIPAGYSWGECSESNCPLFSSCLNCASDHRQIAEWLRELKAYRKAEKEIIDDEPKEKWIPVSERLPEKLKEVIVTDIETSDTYTSYYIGDGYWECDNGAFKNRIIAWMPKPEPYEENVRPATKEEQLDNIRKKTEPFMVAQELKKRLEDKNE